MENIKTTLLNNVLTVVMSRPEALNALNIKSLEELDNALTQAIQTKEVRGIVITGEGEKAFVAGADIKEIAALNKEKATLLAQKGQKLFKKIEDCEKPIIAAINGFALGGGCELAMACHIRVATENAKFGQPEVNLGIIPGYGGTQRFAQLVGRGKALELLLTGDLISASEAKSIGLINHVVENREALTDSVTKMMTKILSKAPVAIAGVIRSINAGFGFEQSGYNAEIENFANCTTTKDFNEGTLAFIEKRQPNFKGE